MFSSTTRPSHCIWPIGQRPVSASDIRPPPYVAFHFHVFRMSADALMPQPDPAQDGTRFLLRREGGALPLEDCRRGRWTSQGCQGQAAFGAPGARCAVARRVRRMRPMYSCSFGLAHSGRRRSHRQGKNSGWDIDIGIVINRVYPGDYRETGIKDIDKSYRGNVERIKAVLEEKSPSSLLVRVLARALTSSTVKSPMSFRNPKTQIARTSADRHLSKSWRPRAR